MGSSHSKESEEIANLRQDFVDYQKNVAKLINDKVYEQIDANRDGVLTHDEFSEWSDEYGKNITKMIDNLKEENELRVKKLEKNYDQTIEAKDTEIKELKNKIKFIKEQNEKLENNNCQLLQGIENPVDNFEIQSVISRTKISKFVDELLRTDTLNLDKIPDWIEKPIYKNVIVIVMHIIDKMAKETSIDLFGHKMRLIMQ